MAHPNEENLRKAYEAFADADMDTVMGLFADDIQFHVPGRSEVAGDYSGKEEVEGFIMKLMELTGGTFRLEVHDVLANDEHTIGLVTLKAERRDKRLNQNDVHVWHVRDGKFSEFWGHPGTLYDFDEFFS
jgi:uncharacterized protein